MIPLLLAGVALAGSPGKTCAPVTVFAPGSGAYAYDVRVEEGAATCGVARSALRTFIATTRAPAGWTCFRGHTGDAWAAACSRGGAIVRAYSPRRVTDPWAVAAAKLSMPVLAPSKPPLGLPLRYVKPQKLTHCGPIKEQATAQYKAGKREVFVIEGKPRVCGDIGDATQIGRPVVNGKRGFLYDYGRDAFLLLWFERGIQVGIQTAGVTRAQLVALANTFGLVHE